MYPIFVPDVTCLVLLYGGNECFIPTYLQICTVNGVIRVPSASIEDGEHRSVIT